MLDEYILSQSSLIEAVFLTYNIDYDEWSVETVSILSNRGGVSDATNQSRGGPMTKSQSSLIEAVFLTFLYDKLMED